MVPNMNSIFTTEEDFEFSDDDSLNLSLFNQPLRGEKSPTEEQFKDSSLSKEVTLNAASYESSNIKCDEGINHERHDHSKDYSSHRSRLKERVNYGNFDSEKFDTKGPVLSHNDSSRINLRKGYKFNSKAVLQKQHNLESSCTIQSNNALIPAQTQMQDIFSLGPIFDNDKREFRSNIYMENRRSVDFDFDNQSKQFEKKCKSHDEPFREGLCLGEERPDMQPCHFSINSNKEIKSIVVKRSNDMPNDRLSKNEDNIDISLPREAQNTTSSKKRKFPGPAGVLPRLEASQNVGHISTPNSRSSKRRSKTPKSITPTKLVEKEDSDFHKSFWSRLQKQALQKYKGLVYHSISSTLRKACSNQLEKGKVPLMCVLIKAFTLNGSDASVILKDPTGEINGTIHKGVLESYQTGLCPGSGMILKQVSIFSPSSRRHYVNITPSNIMLLQGEDACTQVMPSSDDDACSMLTDKTVANGGSPSKPLNVEGSHQEEDDIDALFADDDEDFDSWLSDSEDFLTEVLEKQLY